MPEVHDPFHGKRRRRRKRKTTGESVGAPDPVRKAVRADSTSGDIPTSSSSLSRLPLLAPPPKTILKKNPKHQPTVTTFIKDPFEFDATSSQSTKPHTDDDDDNNNPEFQQSFDRDSKAPSITTPTTKSLSVAVTDWKARRPKEDVSYSPMLSHSLLTHAVALDTRFLDTPEGRDDYQMFKQGVQTFLYACSSRGILPSLLVWKGYDASLSLGGQMDDMRTILKCETLSEDTLASTCRTALSGIPVLGLGGNEKKDVGIRVPEEVSPATSWNCLLEMVRTIVHRRKGKEDDPICVTILTRDLSFLLDADTKSHHGGLERFMEGTEQHFLDTKLQTIRICVAVGRVVPLNISERQSDSTIDDEEIMMNEQSSKRTAQVSSLLASLQSRIESKGEEIFKRNRSQIQFDSKCVARMDIRIFSIDIANGFQSLLQTVSQGALSTFPRGWHQTLSLVLPETADFDACVVIVQASYKSMPFRLDSTLANSLRCDLVILGCSKFSVLQLTPIESIDASLLYGIPISIRAGLTESTEEHRENLMILQSMLKTLAVKDCALFLSARLPESVSNDGWEGNPLFQDSRNKFFVLMPELLGSKVGPPTYNGVLFRVASSDCILDQYTPDDARKSVQSLDSEIGQTNEYQDFVETSLESLACSPLNPLLSYEVKNSPECEIASPDRKKVTWKEGCLRTTSVLWGRTSDEVLEASSPSMAANDAVWRDDSGIGMVMTEREKCVDCEASQEKKTHRDDEDWRKGDAGLTCTVNDSATTLDSARSSVFQKTGTNLAAETRLDIKLQENSSGEDEDGDTNKWKSLISVTLRGSSNNDNESDDIEESDDDPMIAMKIEERPKRKPTEVLPFHGVAQVSSENEDEVEWTQEDGKEKYCDGDDELCDGDDSCNSSSSSSSDSSAGDVSFGRFEYSS
ncbi:hypothetical protein IV203_008342 [Nitzschia inconspicua]|uniref:Uncharacterized protein n=1 Tax=Nitzschia inconspicua TaxID=303405 RepID=A0A9K3KYC5_9STRA|nr:hypothetical protein IV203_008342 [Nitzschia inconspicua]